MYCPTLLPPTGLTHLNPSLPLRMREDFCDAKGLKKRCVLRGSSACRLKTGQPVMWTAGSVRVLYSPYTCALPHTTRL